MTKKVISSIIFLSGSVLKSRRKRSIGNEKDKLVQLLLAMASFYEDRSAKKPLKHSCFNKTVICLPGQKGERGHPGAVGPMGPQGHKGEKGDEGKLGPRGLKGDQGLIGQRGDKGAKGEIGNQGPIGFPGAKGIKGQKGEGALGKPRIISAPANQTVTENGSVTFTCEAEGNPEPKIRWYFHGRIVDKKRYSYPTKTGLMIEKVQFKDKGNITCISHNLLGEVNATAELVVWGEYTHFLQIYNSFEPLWIEYYL